MQKYEQLKLKNSIQASKSQEPEIHKLYFIYDSI